MFKRVFVKGFLIACLIPSLNWGSGSITAAFMLEGSGS